MAKILGTESLPASNKHDLILPWGRDIQAVLFDFDGTLVDSSEVICTCFNFALRSHGAPEQEEVTICRLIGRPLKEMFAELGNGLPVDPLIASYREIFAELAPGRSKLLPGAAELLRNLHPAVKLAIVTSRSGSGTVALLKSHQLDTLFSTVVGIEHVSRGKPHPEPVEIALRILGVPAESSVFVGDTVYDMEAASAAGVFAIGVTTGANTRQELFEAGADAAVESLEQLQELASGSRT